MTSSETGDQAETLRDPEPVWEGSRVAVTVHVDAETAVSAGVIGSGCYRFASIKIGPATTVLVSDPTVLEDLAAVVDQVRLDLLAPDRDRPEAWSA